MNKKIITTCTCFVLVVLIGGIIFINKNNKKDNTNNLNNYSTVIYDKDGNIVYSTER